MTSVQLDSLEQVVANALCHGCGACTVACAHDAVVMVETPAGQLVARVSTDRCRECAHCSALTVCPGASVDFALPDDIHPCRGTTLGAFIGHANDPAVRHAACSGGVVTALLLSLLESNSIDAALVTAFPHDGSLRPKALLARSREEILSARGSKYCPVALDAAFRKVEKGQRIAVVGLPCHMHGLRRLEAAFPWIEASVRCRVGLFCDRTLLFSAIDLLAGDAHLKIESLSGIDYRSAQRSGWPGEVCFITRSGQRVFMSPPGRVHNVADWATVPRCRVCFDKTNALADLSVGDPWGMSQSREGESAVVVRTSDGAAILEAAKAEGSLSLRPIAAEDVFLSQGVDTRAEKYLAYREAWSRTERAVPEYSGVGGFAGLHPTDATSKKARSALTSDFKIAGATTLRGALAWMRVLRELSRPRRAISGRIRRSRG